MSPGRPRGEQSPPRQVARVEEPAVAAPSSSAASGQQIRGRGGYRTELTTIPPNLTQLKADPKAEGQKVALFCNYIELQPMKERQVFKYRVDFAPDVESVSLRRRLFRDATEPEFSGKAIFDGVSDARSGVKLSSDRLEKVLPHPVDAGANIAVTVKLVGVVTGAFEMVRVYNMHMNQFLRTLGFYQVQAGAYIHRELSKGIGGPQADIMSVGGFRTAANVHDEGKILMNLESVHKLVQRKNVRDIMNAIRQTSRQRNSDFMTDIRTNLSGKLVIANHNKIVYRVEDVNFDLSPKSTFLDRRNNCEVSYIDYFRDKHNLEIRDQVQPLLLVIQNNRRRQREEGDSGHDIYIVPELCNIAGLTESQKADTRLRIDLVRSSQIPPKDRVASLRKFLGQLHSNEQVADVLNRWGYSYGKEPLKVRARVMPRESIGLGQAARGPKDKWSKVDDMASFDRDVQRETLAKAPSLPKMALIISRTDAEKENHITQKLRTAFAKIGLNPTNVDVERIREGDSAHLFANKLRNLPADTTAAIVILPRQDKERYDTIKKIASVDRGLITQVVTSKLMTDERKAGGASIKIGIQLAAKLGGEPWYINLPMTDAMVCGYDTYHDSAQRGRSFGAFTASMNNTFSRWFSKADRHDRLEELSNQIATNLRTALDKYRSTNGSYPQRVFIYRDGVSDGQIDHVFTVELEGLKNVIKERSKECRLTFIIVNKRIGARFYMEKGRDDFQNPPPGTVIDSTVTRKERFDFYLISQSTRQGTVAPTYYNIIHDESGLDPAKHQAMAFKMCFLYYNWTGTVRVPAPCQYAHKLAYLCGEHLHSSPNALLDDKLHFL